MLESDLGLNLLGKLLVWHRRVTNDLAKDERRLHDIITQLDEGYSYFG